MTPIRLIDTNPLEELYRGTVIRIHKWFKCPTGFYDYDMMLIDGSEGYKSLSFDVICINHSAGARNLLSPLKCNVGNTQAITAGKLFDEILDFLNAIKGRELDFTKDEVKDHIFIYQIEDVREIYTDLIPFTGNETYNS